VVEEIVLALEKISKILIFSHENLAKNQFYLALVKLVKMFMSMKVTKWYSLPLAREGGSVSCFQCLISVFSPSISLGKLS
jgi:hypothetical protein